MTRTQILNQAVYRHERWGNALFESAKSPPASRATPLNETSEHVCKIRDWLIDRQGWDEERAEYAYSPKVSNGDTLLVRWQPARDADGRYSGRLIAGRWYDCSGDCPWQECKEDMCPDYNCYYSLVESQVIEVCVLEPDLGLSRCKGKRVGWALFYAEMVLFDYMTTFE